MSEIDMIVLSLLALLADLKSSVLKDIRLTDEDEKLMITMAILTAKMCNTNPQNEMLLIVRDLAASPKGVLALYKHINSLPEDERKDHMIGLARMVAVDRERA